MKANNGSKRQWSRGGEGYGESKKWLQEPNKIVTEFEASFIATGKFRSCCIIFYYKLLDKYLVHIIFTELCMIGDMYNFRIKPGKA